MTDRPSENTARPIVRQTRRGDAIQFGAPREVSLFEIDLPVAGLPAELAGLSILHLSDTHFRPGWSERYDALLATIESLHVDLIAFTGDWVEDKFDFRVGLETAQRFARGLRSKFGTFACLGNHDGDLITPHLMDAGVTVLIGEAKRILGGASAIEIVGVPSMMREDVSPAILEPLGQPAADAFRLTLTHYPDHIRQIGSLHSHLVLAGHTHGGQLCLPGGRPLITHDSLPREFSSGLHRVDETWLHVTRGIGCSAWNFRMFCPSEMSVFRLKNV